MDIHSVQQHQQQQQAHGNASLARNIMNAPSHNTCMKIAYLKKGGFFIKVKKERERKRRGMKWQGQKRADRPTDPFFPSPSRSSFGIVRLYSLLVLCILLCTTIAAVGK